MQLRHTLIFLALALLAGCASDKSHKPAPAAPPPPAHAPAQAERLYAEFQSAFLNGDYDAAKRLVADDGELAAKLFDSHWKLAHPADGAGNVTIVFEQLIPEGDAYVGQFKISVEQTQPGNPGVKGVRIREQGVAIVKDAQGKWSLHL